jgi:hypothetical protein
MSRSRLEKWKTQWSVMACAGLLAAVTYALNAAPVEPPKREDAATREAVRGTIVGESTGEKGVEKGVEEVPDPALILRSVRELQASIRQTLQGRLRKSGRTVAYKMVMEGGRVRFEFPEAEPPNPRVVVLTFGETGSSLEVTGSSGTGQTVDFTDEIGGMGVHFEDLALRFLYWNDAVLEGEERLMLSKCWRIRVRRPERVRSLYSQVVVWVSQSNGAFLKSEGYGENGVLLKRLTVRSVQSIGQVTTLKQLRIETMDKSEEPTYLDVDGQPAPRVTK